jgi:hypothetical protein
VLESNNNLSLVENGLLHIEFEMNRSKPSMFRAARESHLVLYRSMIEALKGSANLAVTGRPSKNRMHQYCRGNEPWKEIHKVPVPGCSQAWRFSEPVLCAEPEIDYTQIPELRRDDYLISFYDALAMIQSECFMHQYVMSREVAVSDDEMKQLEWLHEDIRNEYEHFVPKGYSAPVRTLIQLTILSLRVSREVLFDSKNVFPSSDHEKIAGTIDNIIEELTYMMGTVAAQQAVQVAGLSISAN